MAPKIVSFQRIYMGGRYINMAFGEGEKMLVGYVAHPKNGPSWMRQPCTKAEKAKLTADVAEMFD